MLHLDPIEMLNTYRSAVHSAELLRESGDPAKAERVESLARILARELRLAASPGNDATAGRRSARSSAR